MEIGREMRSAIAALEELSRPAAERRDLSAAADREFRMLQVMDARVSASLGSRERALAHIERLETLLVESLSLAADRCVATADTLALLEERYDVSSGPAWGLSARSARALACRLRREAQRRSPPT